MRSYRKEYDEKKIHSAVIFHLFLNLNISRCVEVDAIERVEVEEYAKIEAKRLKSNMTTNISPSVALRQFYGCKFLGAKTTSVKQTAT